MSKQVKQVINEIKQFKVSDLHKHPSNPRTLKDTAYNTLKQSIEANPELLEARPLILSNRTGKNIVIGGNQRLQVVKDLGWLHVPCVLFPDMSEEKEREIMIRDNVSNGEWDWDKLANEWDSAELNYWGLEVPDWEQEQEEYEGQTDQDAAPELEPEAVTRLGDLWMLGNHRLICADSNTIIPPENSGLFFDPPWDIDYPKLESKSILAFTDCQRAKDIISMYGSPTWVFVWDCVSSWYTPNRPLKRSKLCLWFGDIEKFNFNGSHYGDAGEVREVFNTRGSYTFQPDARGKHLSDVFQMAITQLHSKENHSHSKPVDWVRMLIADCIPQEIVFDPYAGSGVSLIACEQINKKCVAVEVDPIYCDVIIKRWQDFTGKQATLEATGETFEEVKNGRAS